MIEKKFKLIAKNAAQKQIGEMKKVIRVGMIEKLKNLD